MRRSFRLAVLTLFSTALLAASGSTALAATPDTDAPINGAPINGAPVNRAAATALEQQRVLDYWTPERMRSAVPLEELAGDVLATKRASGTVERGTPTVIAPTAPQSTGDAGVLAFPHSGGPWTGGGAVTQTAGRVFFVYQGRPASCSGNAVTSANRSTVMTAGHCVKLDGAWHTNWVFVPGYHNGNDPFGTWTANQTMATAQWVSSENINHDVGAAVVNPLGGQLLTDVVGGQGIAFNQSRGLPMYAFGYPAASPYDGSQLIYCSGNTFNDFFTTAIGMTCDMTGGSSGGPWFMNFSESTGLGIQNSVNSFKYIFWPNRMYGPYFGSSSQSLYQTAQSS
jgi:hypothetical protein